MTSFLLHLDLHGECCVFVILYLRDPLMITDVITAIKLQTKLLSFIAGKISANFEFSQEFQHFFMCAVK